MPSVIYFESSNLIQILSLFNFMVRPICRGVNAFYLLLNFHSFVKHNNAQVPVD